MLSLKVKISHIKRQHLFYTTYFKSYQYYNLSEILIITCFCSYLS